MGRAQAWLAAMLVVACAGAGDDGTGVTTTSTTTTSEATGSTGGTPTSGQAGSSEGGSTGTASTSGSTGSSEAGGSTGSTTGAPVATTEGSEASTGAPSPVIETLRITDKNPHYVEMHGGWGPHLRGLMRAADDALWFTADRGEDVLHNREILYLSQNTQI